MSTVLHEVRVELSVSIRDWHTAKLTFGQQTGKFIHWPEGSALDMDDCLQLIHVNTLAVASRIVTNEKIKHSSVQTSVCCLLCLHSSQKIYSRAISSNFTFYPSRLYSKVTEFALSKLKYSE